MAEKIPMTALSPTMEEGTITAWRAKVGDEVAAGDVLCEVETDKASMEYEATQEGTLLKIIVEEGGNASVGKTIAIIGEKGEDTTSLEEEVASESDSAPAAPATETESSNEVSDDGTGAQPDSKSAESDSASDADGKTSTAQSPQPTESRSEGSRIKASPLAVKLAAERNINLSLIKGSGTGGRIVKRDIEDFRGVPASAAASGAPRMANVGAMAPAGDETIPVAGKRAVIAKRLSESKFSAPHYYLKMSVEMANMMSARKMLNDSLPDKVSLNAFFIKFAAEALKRHPIVNASWQGDKIVQYGSIDVGIAVDVGNGLITPVVRNCGNRGIVDIDAELQELIGKAREGKLKPDEYTGATFTISNLGSFGVEEFTAIINPPGAAILALGATRPTPVAGSDGSIRVANVMKMTLSCDHRVIDGAAGGQFLRELQGMIEQPVRIIF